MVNLKKSVQKDMRVLVQDATSHLIYSIFIIVCSSLVTYFLLVPFVEKLVKSDTPKTVSSIILPGVKEEKYVERGSPYDNRDVRNSSESTLVIFHGPRDKKQIALTFDAEMTDAMKANVLSGKVKSSYDKRIVDILNKTHTKATLFLTGMWIEMYPRETKEFSENPLFELGSHSYSDTSFHGFCYGLEQIPSTVAIEEIGAAEKLLREHAGIDNKLFRFPGGCYTPEDVELVKKAGDTVVHWDISGADGFNQNTAQIVKNIADNTQNGSIIILHLNGEPTAPKTAEALPAIISSLKGKGFEFVKVSELLGLQPALKARNF